MFKYPFGKTKPPSDESRWTVAQGSEDGLPLIYRIRNHPPSGIAPADYPVMMAIPWKYEPANEMGMPSPEDTARMNRLEELLDPALENSKTAFLTVVVTGNGAREWQWYARSTEAIMERINEILGDEDFPVRFIHDEDPDWNGYRQFHELTQG